MALLNKKFRASTLIEVLIAMMIILASAGIGMTAVSNLSRDINGDVKIQALIKMEDILSHTKFENNYTDKVFEYTGFRIERTIESFKESNRLKIIRIKAIAHTKRTVGEIREIIVLQP